MYPLDKSNRTRQGKSRRTVPPSEEKRKRVSVWLAGVSYHSHTSPESGPDPACQETASANQTASVVSEETSSNRPGTPARWDKPQSKRSADVMLHNNDGSSEGDDVLLFDSLPEKRRCLEGCHPFRAVLPALETLGLKAWNKEKAKWRVVSAPGTENHGPAAAPGKRGQVLGEIEENGHDGSSDSYTAVTDCDEPDAVIFVSCRQLQTAKAPLACPFYKLDPARYRNCLWEMELSDIRSLQQHVIVNHCRPEYCPICWTVFDSTAGRNCHIVARTCRKSDDLSSHTASLLLGVSEDQVEQLLALEERCRTGKGKRKGKKGREGGEKRSGNQTTRAAAVSEEEKWFLIWGILFPTAPRPASAYLSSPREREAVGMRHFWDKAGPGLLAGVLKRKKMLRWEDPQEEVALAALHTSVLKGMMESSGLIYSRDSPGTGIE